MTFHVVQLGPVPPPHGGISTNMFAIRDEVLRRGGRCSLVATSRSSEIVSEEKVYHPGTPIELISIVRRLKADVLHLHIGGELPPRVVALMLAVSTLARRSLLTFHSGGFPDSDAGKRASRMSLRGVAARRFDRIIAVNDALADVFERYGVPKNKISVLSPFSPSKPDPEVILPDRLATFIDDHSPILLAVGGLERDYDPSFQIAAMKEILAANPNAGLLIVGDGSLRDEVENTVRSSGYAHNIMIAGNVDHAVTLRLINDADILLRTTLFDGDAISVREALHLGTPVIATDNGMRPDGVRLITQGDEAGFVRAVSELAAAEKSKKTPQPADMTDIRAIVSIYESLI